MSNQCFPFCETFYEYEGRLICTECNTYKDCSDDYWTQVDEYWEEHKNDPFTEKELWDNYQNEYARQQVEYYRDEWEKP